MKKTSIRFLSVALIAVFVISLPLFVAAEEPAIPDPITMEESNALIQEAIDLRRTYQNAKYMVLGSVASCDPPDAVADEQGVLYDPTEEKYRTEDARTATILAIYTGEAVSKVSIINPNLQNNGKQNAFYTLNGDLYIYSWRNVEKFKLETLYHPIDYYIEYWHLVDLSIRERENLLLTVPGEITQDESGVCTRTFTIAHNIQKANNSIESVKETMTAEFTKTADGWRISGGSLVDTLYPKYIPKTADNTALTVWTAAAILSLTVLAGAVGCKLALSRKDHAAA